MKREALSIAGEAGDTAVISGENASGGISAGDTVVADADAEGLTDGVKVKTRK